MTRNGEHERNGQRRRVLLIGALRCRREERLAWPPILYGPVFGGADAYPDGDEDHLLDPAIGSEMPYLLH